MTTLPEFIPPSPGAWELEQTHLTRPVSVYMAEVLPAPMMRGFADGTKAYGVLLDYLDIAVINRFGYAAPRPVGAPKSAKGTPPRFVFEILRRLHPEIRRRVKRADKVISDRYWRHDVQWWHTEVKPSMAATAQTLMQDDLQALSTPALVDHIRRATAFLNEATYYHHRFNMCAMLPIGDFICHLMDWTGLPAGAILQAVRGLSPVSAGAVEELAAVRRAILADADAMAVLVANRPAADVLAALESRSDAVGSAVRAYLAVVGLRILGAYDPGEKHAREHPELLVKIIRTAVTTDEVTRQATAERAIAGLRETVPPEHRAEFDVLLEDIRLTYCVRDERIFHGDAIAAGLARRAILAAGDRLTAQRKAHEPAHLIDATSDEMIALLEGRPGPSADELAERTRFRFETPLSAAPERLGFPPSPPPPAEWLPASAARLQRAVSIVLSLMFDTHKRSESKILKGFGVSPGVFEGPARVIRNVDELPLVQQGEVLVASATSSTFNVVLPLIGALVTERGGALCHAAIVAREYGLPGVVGCPGALAAIKTGMRVGVNGETGEVWTIG
jgi:pyruvate,water dikinase